MDINILNVNHPSMPNRADLEVEAKNAANLDKVKSANVQGAENVTSTQIVEGTKKADGLGVRNERVKEQAEEQAKEQETEALEAVVEELSDVMALMNKGLAFSVDEDSGAAVVKVMDIDSGEIIRQIPSDEALELAQKLQDVKGLLMRTEA